MMLMIMYQQLKTSWSSPLSFSLSSGQRWRRYLLGVRVENRGSRTGQAKNDVDEKDGEEEGKPYDKLVGSIGDRRGGINYLCI